MEEKIYCSHCGALIEDDDYEEVGGEIVCTDCYEHHTTTCDRCGSVIWTDDSYGDEYTTLCSSCYHNHYTRCTCCDALLHEDDAYHLDGYTCDEIEDMLADHDLLRETLQMVKCEDRQSEALTRFGVPPESIIIDKCSGKDTEREGYQYLKRQILREGDTLVIKELDRLSRNKADIKRELEEFKAKGIRVKILDIPTTLTDFPKEQMWVMDMINSILIEVLGAIAENERNKIRSQQPCAV